MSAIAADPDRWRDGIAPAAAREAPALPPHDLEAERSILGAAIYDGARLAELDGLRPEHHYSEAHRRIHEALLELRDAGTAISIVTVQAALRASGRLVSVGGSAYLTDLVGTAVPSRSQLAAHVAIVAGHARARRLAELGDRLGELARGGAGQAAIDATIGELAAVGGARVGSAGLLDRLVAVDPAWLADAPPSRQYLAVDARTGRGALDAEGVALLVAAGGAGKSYATIALALAVATGGTWLDVLRVERPARVLLVAAEESAAEVRRRLYRLARSAGVTGLPPGAIDVLDVHDRHLPLLDADARPTDHAAALVALARDRGPYALVVVDPLARVAGASVDADNVAAAALVTALETVGTAAGGLVVGVHHSSGWARRAGVTDATAVRGATGLGDSARLVLTLGVERVEHDDADVAARLGEIVTLRRAKANHVPPWAPIELRRGEHGELLPLDAHDRALLAEARRGADPATQRATARTDERTRRDRENADAARQIVAGRPGIHTGDLEAALMATLHCGRDRARAAIAGAALASEPAAGRGHGRSWRVS